MIAVIVPALDPSVTLIDLVRDILTSSSIRIVVVDDGSRDQAVFKVLTNMELVTVLHHELNRGKGDALKTGNFATLWPMTT